MGKQDYFRFLYVLVVSCFSVIRGQQLTLMGCPSGWERFSDSCYKFVSSEPRIKGEAAAACWLYGANLVSVNSIQENEFIAKWLKTHDALRPTTWFTSGVFYGGRIQWLGDNTVNDPQLTFWMTPPTTHTIGSLIAYAAPTDSVLVKYGWKVITNSAPGSYICEIPQSQASTIGTIYRDFGYGQADIDINDILRGPEMKTEPRPVAVFVPGVGSIFVECNSLANPTPVYRWFRDNVSISSTTSDRYTLSGGRLTIENPMEDEDGGFYWCEVENSFGKVQSKKAQVLFAFLHYFSPVQPTDFWSRAFEGTRVKCDSPGANPGVTYRWYKFHTNNWVWPGHPSHFVSQSGYLYFSEVQPTDGRQYFCVVTLSAPVEFVVSTSQPPSRVSLGRYLIIEGAKTTGNYGPIIYTHAFPSPAMRGRKIRLECIAYGSSPLTYSWWREDGRPFEKGTKLWGRNRILTIPNAQMEAQGNYVCKCSRPGASDTKIISVVMESSPYFPFPMRDMLVDNGQKVNWRCKAVARPAATYTWFKNGVPISSVPGVIQVQGTYLIINMVDKSRDEGMYQCAATNEHGTSYTNGQLEVLSFAPTLSRNRLPDVTLGPVGGNITISCHVEAAPAPNVVWSKDGGNLNLMPGDTGARLWMTVQNDLVLRGISYSDAGFYTCTATNEHGKASESTRLQTVAGIVITRAPAATQAVVNTTAFMFCQAAYNHAEFDLTYTWTFNGHPINYQLAPHYQMGTEFGVNGLYIVSAQYIHQGVYECRARTAFHVESSSAFLTVRGPPGPIAGVYVKGDSVTAYSARLIWTVGVETGHNEPIISYDIEGETHFHPGEWKVYAIDVPDPLTLQDGVNLGLRPDQRTAEVRGLIPGSGYSFRVRAINSLGRGHEASKPSEVVKIPDSAPILPPQNLVGGGGKVGTLTIQWQELDISEHCGPGFGYTVYWKMKSNGNTQDWTVKNVGAVGQSVALVGGDNYYLEYEVKVAAFNDVGSGPNSTVSVIFSAEGIPVAVPYITTTVSINCTAVMVYWNPVADLRSDMKGRVKGYTIQYFTNMGNMSPFKGYVPTRLTTREVYGQRDHINVVGLDINAEFFFRLQVFNSAARGPKGEWRRGETYKTFPRSWPKFVEVHPHTLHSVRVKWQGISTTQYEESVLGYIMRVWKVQDNFLTGNDTKIGKVSEAVLENLQTETVYILRVRGYSLGGNGVQSTAMYFTVLGGQIAIDPTTSQICYEGLSCGHGNAVFSMTSFLWLSLVNVFIIQTFKVIV